MGWMKRHDNDEEELESKVRYAAQLHGVRAKEVVDAVFDEDEDEDDIDAAEEGGHRRSKLGLVATLAVIGIVFGIGVAFLMSLANRADKAGPLAVAGIAAAQASIAPTPPANPTLSGIHISFTYPAVFDEVQHPSALSNTSERYALSSKDDYRKSVQVYVESNPTGQGDSGYMYRSQDKTDYAPVGVKVMGETAVVFVKSDNSERTLYWHHAGNLVVM